MNKDIEVILQQFRQKSLDSIFLVEASLKRVNIFDPKKEYTPDEREPYDALCDRFIRAVEISIKFFKSYEIKMFGESSDTLRDLMLRMEKTGMISSLDIWFRMRDEEIESFTTICRKKFRPYTTTFDSFSPMS